VIAVGNCIEWVRAVKKQSQNFFDLSICYRFGTNIYRSYPSIHFFFEKTLWMSGEGAFSIKTVYIDKDMGNT